MYFETLVQDGVEFINCILMTYATKLSEYPLKKLALDLFVSLGEFPEQLELLLAKHLDLFLSATKTAYLAQQSEYRGTHIRIFLQLTYNYGESIASNKDIFVGRLGIQFGQKQSIELEVVASAEVYVAFFDQIVCVFTSSNRLGILHHQFLELLTIFHCGQFIVASQDNKCEGLRLQWFSRGITVLQFQYLDDKVTKHGDLPFLIDLLRMIHL